MNKFLKTLTAVAVVITLIACIGLLVACGDTNDDQNNGGNEEYTYKFTVVDKDSNPAEGVQVQLCIVDEDGEVLSCKLAVATDANGVVVFTENGMPAVSADSYVIHLLDDNGEQLTFTGAEYTVDGQKDYTLTLTK